MPQQLQREVHIIDHPLAADRLATLRDQATPPALFRRTIRELALLLAISATRDLALRAEEIQTPLEECSGMRLARRPIIAAILRAGLAMTEALQLLLPDAPVAHIGLYRDEKSLEPRRYYFRMPPVDEQSLVLLADPMLATGGTAADAASQLKEAGAGDIRFLCIIACPEGIERMRSAHPEVQIFTAAVDRELDENGYIRPGLGDAGDRSFATPS